MAMDAKDGETEKVPLWQFVRVGDYALPTTAVSRTAFKKWAAFKQIFRHSDANGEPPFKAEEELKTLPEVRLAHVVPPIDWDTVADALDLALGDWLQASSPESPVKFVIGQPHSGHGELLDHWANRHDACRVEAPSLKQILSRDEHWLAAWPGKGKRWVLPHLEHCYLRHANGLGLVRRFLEMAVDGRLGPGLIGCDSWARAYLQRVCLSSYWDAWTLQSFDGERLARLFTRDGNAQRQRPLRFLNAKNGKPILSAPLNKNGDVSSELTQLAARCRGNFGTALDHWRWRLRAEPDREEEDSGDAGERGDRADKQEDAVWVSDLAKAPVLPAEKEVEMDLVLHALLLHNGLPESLLPDLLPLPRYRIVSLVRRLQSLGIVDAEGDRYKVTAVGYSAAREHLAARDYLLDDF